ncbi:hypothetical protein [Nostoc sp.]|uniref:hypothetical protein n=1 Tax=Nostoc sp. TaxID=1180 RepID=UPI002FF6D1B1
MFSLLLTILQHLLHEDNIISIQTVIVVFGNAILIFSFDYSTTTFISLAIIIKSLSEISKCPNRNSCPQLFLSLVKDNSSSSGRIETGAAGFEIHVKPIRIKSVSHIELINSTDFHFADGGKTFRSTDIGS